MKKYIILAYNITNIGGEHQYCRNKIVEVTKMGYTPILFSGNNGPIYIPELQKFKDNTFTALKYPPYCFTKSRVKQTVMQIVNVIGDVSEDSIIECLSVAGTEWGELIADFLNIKSLGFILDEKSNVSKQECSFLFFKHKRKELASISCTTYCNLFKPYIKIKSAEANVIEAFCTNSIESIPYDKEIKTNDNVVFGSIGRLEKGYVWPVLCELKKYCLLHSKQDFAILLIGGTTNNKILNQIKKLFLDVLNVQVHITGYIYPIPYDLVSQIDIAIGTAGGAEIAALQLNKPCISVDTHTGTPIGILNYTTKETTYSNSNSNLSLSYYIDLINKGFCYNNSDLGMSYSVTDLSFEVEKQFEKFVYTDVNKCFYDVMLLKAETLQYLIYAVIGKTFGPKILQYLHRRIIHPLKKYL